MEEHTSAKGKEDYTYTLLWSDGCDILLNKASKVQAWEKVECIKQGGSF